MIKDFIEVKHTSDWTYSTPYKGTVRYLSQASKDIKEQTNLDLDVAAEPLVGHIELKVEPESKIPFHLLGQDNPIIHFSEVYLFEDDLEDSGYTMSKLRFRVMANCFYVLLRFYLRVDGVKVRVYDTRIFHQFGENFIHREF